MTTPKNSTTPACCSAAHATDAGTQGVDPVCGMTVAPDSPHRFLHAGHEYRFCSARCRDKFQSDPQRYLAHSKPATAPPMTAGTRYTCPMHPQIVRDGPGTCPLCGMALEPMMPSLEDEANPELTDFRRRFVWTLPLSVAVLVLAMAGHRWEMLTPTVRTWVEFGLATPVVMWAGWPFFERWMQSLVHRSPNMWTLIGTGVAAAFGYSVVATLAPQWFPDSFREHVSIHRHRGIQIRAEHAIVFRIHASQIHTQPRHAPAPIGQENEISRLGRNMRWLRLRG